jgi:hypothetical protein
MKLMDAFGTHMCPLLFFRPTTSQRTTNLTITGSFDDYHGEIAFLKLFVNRKVLQHAVSMYMITGNAEDRSLKC